MIGICGNHTYSGGRRSADLDPNLASGVDSVELNTLLSMFIQYQDPIKSKQLASRRYRSLISNIQSSPQMVD